jgi:hypothetical protein
MYSTVQNINFSDFEQTPAHFNEILNHCCLLIPASQVDFVFLQKNLLALLNLFNLLTLLTLYHFTSPYITYVYTYVCMYVCTRMYINVTSLLIHPFRPRHVITWQIYIIVFLHRIYIYIYQPCPSTSPSQAGQAARSR